MPLAVAAVAGVAAGSGCATFGRQRLDYSRLESADRPEVGSIDVLDEPIAVITDASKVRHAIDFIRRREDKWGDRVNPYVPTLVLRFYANDRRLGGYGISQTLLIALPDQGFWWRDVPAGEINALLEILGVAFPDRGKGLR